VVPAPGIEGAFSLRMSSMLRHLYLPTYPNSYPRQTFASGFVRRNLYRSEQ
jgi:hypothetical protein